MKEAQDIKISQKRCLGGLRKTKDKRKREKQ